jgi:hypothetical protein
MPREQINYPALVSKSDKVRFNEANPETTDGPWGESAIHLYWQGRETAVHVDGTVHGFVQLGLEVDVDYAKFAAKSPNGRTSDSTYVWSPTLTHGELDRLIGQLKRARKKAFPADE